MRRVGFMFFSTFDYVPPLLLWLPLAAFSTCCCDCLTPRLRVGGGDSCPLETASCFGIPFFRARSFIYPGTPSTRTRSSSRLRP